MNAWEYLWSLEHWWETTALVTAKNVAQEYIFGSLSDLIVVLGPNKKAKTSDVANVDLFEPSESCYNHFLQKRGRLTNMHNVDGFGQCEDWLV